MRFKILIFFLLTGILFTGNALELPSIFSSGMVLQRGKNLQVWGRGKPLSTVFIEPSWDTPNKARVDKEGNWSLTLAASMHAQIATLRISNEGESVFIQDILFGEVWICSGQSNMEIPLVGWPPRDTIEFGNREIQSFHSDSIRMFTVQRGFSFVKARNCSGKWQKAIGKEKQYFSATAYFFAKRILKELNVPVGIIHTSWGGTSAESWTAPEEVTAMSDFAQWKSLYPDLATQQTKLDDFVYSRTTVQVPYGDFKNLNLQDKECKEFDYTDQDWLRMNLPQAWENAGLPGFDGAVWFRKEFTLEQVWKGTAVFSFPGIDDMDQVFLNGTLIGATEISGLWNKPRRYSIPENILKQGKNVLAIRVIDHQGGGGIWDKGAMKIMHTKDTLKHVRLEGEWKFLPVAEFRNGRFYLYPASSLDYLKRPSSQSGSHEVPGSIYNAMVAPLAPYACRGIIWYQGETNVGRAEQYKTLLPALMQSWRRAWNEELPMYIVQIAPYRYNQDGASGYLRNVQRLVAESSKASGLVVTLDLGRSDNVHPPQKFEIGNRAAALALRNQYGKSIPAYGPTVISVTSKKNTLVLNYQHAEGWYLKSSKGFEIAGADKKFYPATVKLQKGLLVLSSKKVSKPVLVRYGMQDDFNASLFNGAGLPASTYTNE
ncbi:MAG: beta galactosidase jelly roll domain-containing protein [Cytophagaceae bacterium]|jgi:sialate O-acetylesterase|nr:beta galactosidase jelly roll domain-containing protein [Cytophagaceae bacterium]